MTDFEAAARIVATATDVFGGIDILVNNAGIVRDRTLVKMTEDDFDAVIATHLKGTFNMARHAVPVMKEAGYGRIVNITSSAGLRGNFGQTNYGAAKAGLMGMTFVWALELGRSGITVNALAPAGATRMTAALAGEGEPDPRLDPAMNAPLVAFLASEAAADVNGQVFGRTDFSYTIFQHPKQIAWMHRDGGWDTEGVAAAVRRHPGPAPPDGRHGDAQGPVPGHGAIVSADGTVTVNHLGLCVTDIDRSRRFYESALGFAFAYEIHPPDPVCSTLLEVAEPVGLLGGVPHQRVVHPRAVALRAPGQPTRRSVG